MLIETAPLKKAMAIAVRFLDKKNVIPVTGMVKLDFETECLRVTTTNLDRTFTTEIKMFCAETHSVLIDGNRFNTFISRIDDESFDVSFDDKSMTVKRKGGKAQFLLCLESFPATPIVPQSDPTMFNGAVLSEALSATLCGTDDDRTTTASWQNLVQIDIDNGFRCLASDTKRIVVCTGDCEGQGQLQIPISAVQILRALLDDDDVKIFQTNNHIFVITDHTFIFRRMSAQFPNIEGFFNIAEFKDGFTVTAEQLSNALGLVASMSDSRLRGVKWTLGEDVTFSAQAQDVGNVEESLGIKPSIELTTGFNIDWLLAVVRQLSGDITLEFWDNGKGIVSLQIVRERLTVTKFIIGSLQIRS
jgi:DNA polymerase III sliding clamp (beta) subunit (PCNA family)